ncbi:MAG: hypothetical protein CMD99_04885 [Gammaproteobacteria bacterium]|nr:hypothetical protein [Gammaproteobacteria bacterium]
MTRHYTGDLTPDLGSIGLDTMDPWVHIIGGGLSGLSLASSLAKLGALPGEVIVSEPDLEALTSKTFSFWFNATEQNFLKPEFSSDTWKLGTDNFQVTHQGSCFRYGTRTGRNVMESALSAIDRHPQIQIAKEIVHIQPKASHCFDSRPCDIDSFQLTQSFVGTEVLFDQPHGISQIELMNQMQTITTGIRFIYVLPLGSHRLLVEHTDFTTMPSDFSILKDLNDRYLQHYFDASQFRITRTEAAHIPMGFKHKSMNWGIPLGARGGMTRDATGYGYRTIRYACDVIAKDLVKYNSTKPYQRLKITTWADQLFLNLIKQRPDVIPKTLMQLANKMSPDRFAAFMMMRSPTDLIHMLRAAPVKPFTCALLGRYQWI